MADWKTLYPFQSNYIEIAVSEASTEKVRLHFIDEENAASPHTIVCVHGNPTWSFTFRRIAADLPPLARVIAVDHIGCGLSDKPQSYNYSLEQHIGNLGRLIEQLDLRNITLVVHDWGGAIGLGAALKHPTRIAKLVLLNTAAFPPPYIPLRIRACRIPVFGNWAMRRLNLFALAALRMTLYRLKRLDPAVAAGLVAPYNSWDSRVAIARFVQDIPRRPHQTTWQALAKMEQSLKMFADLPVEIIWGMKDWCFRPECLDRLQNIFLQANVQRLEDVGHYVMEEAPEEVINTLRAGLI